ncbi:hypothetical protein MRX96_051123 [Rhipicephalus microplus]
MESRPRNPFNPEHLHLSRHLRIYPGSTHRLLRSAVRKATIRGQHSHNESPPKHLAWRPGQRPRVHLAWLQGGRLDQAPQSQLQRRQDLLAVPASLTNAMSTITRIDSSLNDIAPSGGRVLQGGSFVRDSPLETAVRTNDGGVPMGGGLVGDLLLASYAGHQNGGYGSGYVSGYSPGYLSGYGAGHSSGYRFESNKHFAYPGFGGYAYTGAAYCVVLSANPWSEGRASSPSKNSILGPRYVDGCCTAVFFLFSLDATGEITRAHPIMSDPYEGERRTLLHSASVTLAQLSFCEKPAPDLGRLSAVTDC